MIKKFNAGVDWLTGFFLIFGLVGLVMIAPMFVNLLFYHGAKNDGKYGCSCKSNDENKNY